MVDNLQNSKKISIPPPKRYLSKEEFQEYLGLIKIIANFNPQDKKWYLSERKLAITNKEVLKETVLKLKEYVGDEILEVLSDYIKDDTDTVYAEIHGNYLIVYDDLEKYKEVLTYHVRTFDHISGQYVETPVLLAWQKTHGFSTLRGLYWKLNNFANFRIKPFTSLQYYDITLKNFEMRDYQVNSIKAWISDVNVVGAGIVKAPTGSGKSVIAILASLEMLKNKKDARIIYAVNSTTLLKQFQNFAKREDLDFVLVSGEIDELKKGKKSNLTALSISYYYNQKKQNKHEKLKELVSNADLIILDEAHHVPASMAKSFLLDSPQSLRLGLSATPIREDGKELEIQGLLGRISYSIEYTELVQKRYLVPLEYLQFTPKISRKIYEKLKAIQQSYQEQPFSKLYSAILRLFEQSPFTNQQIIRKIIELDKFPALVIVRRIAIAKQLSELLNQEGISSDWVSSKTSLEERIQKIENLKNGKLKVLVSTSLADEGLDIPNLQLVVLMSQGKSRVKLVQRIGRVMRPYSGKSKGYVLDISYGYDIFQRQSQKRLKFVRTEYEGIISIKEI